MKLLFIMVSVASTAIAWSSPDPCADPTTELTVCVSDKWCNCGGEPFSIPINQGCPPHPCIEYKTQNYNEACNTAFQLSANYLNQCSGPGCNQYGDIQVDQFPVNGCCHVRSTRDCRTEGCEGSACDPATDGPVKVCVGERKCFCERPTGEIELETLPPSQSSCDYFDIPGGPFQRDCSPVSTFTPSNIRQACEQAETIINTISDVLHTPCGDGCEEVPGATKNFTRKIEGIPPCCTVERITACRKSST